MDKDKENIKNDELDKKVKNKTKKNFTVPIIAVIAVAFVVIISLGCILYKIGSSGEKNIVGYYELYEMSSNSRSYTNEQLKKLKELGLIVTLELREDKTGTIDLFGEKKDLTYDKKNMTIDGKSASYKIENEKIIMEDEENRLVFEKAEKVEEVESKLQ